MPDNVTTTDLARFGARERALLLELLEHWRDDGLPVDFENEDVRPMLNTESGNVFLTNAEYQAAMINHDNDKLECHYFTPHEGREGFWSELVQVFDEMHPDDQEYMRDLAGAYDFKGLPELEDDDEVTP